MDIREKATLVPAMCMFTKSAEGPFIDLNRDFDFDHVGRMYVKTSFARELGAFAGLPSEQEVQDLRQELMEAEAERDALREEVTELRDFKQAATYTVETLGQKVRKKPGPRPKHEKTQPEVPTAA